MSGHRGGLTLQFERQVVLSIVRKGSAAVDRAANVAVKHGLDILHHLGPWVKVLGSLIISLGAGSVLDFLSFSDAEATQE